MSGLGQGTLADLYRAAGFGHDCVLTGSLGDCARALAAEEWLGKKDLRAFG